MVHNFAKLYRILTRIQPIESYHSPLSNGFCLVKIRYKLRPLWTIRVGDFSIWSSDLEKCEFFRNILQLLHFPYIILKFLTNLQIYCIFLTKYLKFITNFWTYLQIPFKMHKMSTSTAAHITAQNGDFDPNC